MIPIDELSSLATALFARVCGAARRTFGLWGSRSESELLFRRIVEHTPDCIKLLDLEGRLLWMNRPGRRLMEVCDVRGLIGTRWVELWEGEARRAATAALGSASAGQVGRFHGECATLGGTMKWWNVVVSSVADSSSPIAFLVISREVTDLMAVAQQHHVLAERERAARMDAERASEFRDELLERVAHDLRTALNSVVGWSGLLQEDHQDDSEAADGLRRAVDWQWRLIQQLLDGASVTGSRLEPGTTPVDSGEVVRDVVRVLRPLADAKRLHVDAVTAPRGGTVRASRSHFYTVLANLVSNAVQYTPPGGQVTIRVQAGDGVVRISVADSGIGLTPEEAGRVFDRFWRADSPLTRQERGLGLGLGIAQALTALYAGTIAVESRGPGCGSTFTVTWPAASANQISAGASHTMALGSGSAVDGALDRSATEEFRDATHEERRRHGFNHV